MCPLADGGKTLTFFNNDYKGEFQTVTFEGPEVKKLFYGSFHKVLLPNFPLLFDRLISHALIKIKKFTRMLAYICNAESRGFDVSTTYRCCFPSLSSTVIKVYIGMTQLRS